MTSLHLPWLSLSALVPLVGAAWIHRNRDAAESRRRCVIVATIVLMAAFGAWLDFTILDVSIASDPLNSLIAGADRPALVLDHVSAPLLPNVALLFWLTIVVTPKTKMARFSFSYTLLSEAISLATFCCQVPWGIVGLLIAGMVPPLLELRARRKPTGVFVAYMGVCAVLLVAGWHLASSVVATQPGREWLLVLLVIALLIRKGIVPFHSWIPELFEHATFGTALLFVVPMVDVWAAIRLIVPLEPDWVLRSLGMVSLATAVYAAGMALVQRDARRFFAYVFISHSALVFVGLDSVDPLGLTGGLCLWLSSGLALTGFGLSLRALEARRGRMSLTDFHGGYEHMPALATCFLLTGLASVGFPGTFGFVGAELLVDSAVAVYPSVGIAVAIAGALNGIAVVHAYFQLFTGKRHAPTISIQMRTREQLGVLTLAGLLLLGGILPQPFVASRHRAAEQILFSRPAAGRSETEQTALEPPAEQSASRPILVKIP